MNKWLFPLLVLAAMSFMQPVIYGLAASQDMPSPAPLMNDGDPPPPDFTAPAPLISSIA